jgi:hypothetical protein
MFGGDLLWAWAVRRAFAGTCRIRFARWAALAFVGLMAVSLALMMGGRIAGVQLDGFLPQIVVIALFTWHFIGLGVGIILAIPYLASLGTMRLLERRSAVPDAPAQEALQETVSRRAFLARTTVVAPAIVTLGATGLSAVELDRFRIRALDVAIRDLPSRIDGLTIAHLSDVHLGQFTTQATFRKLVAATNDLDADLVLQTGDLINFDQRDLPVAAELTHALRGRHGHFMCEGNHDLIQGREAFRRFARGARLPILVNEGADVEVNGTVISILGLPWLSVPRSTSVDAPLAEAVGRLAAKRSPAAFPILLAHHPHAFDGAIASGLPLTLAGHTHGGQLQLSRNVGFGPLMYRYWSGLYHREGGACVVSNGAGNWFPVRMNAPAEILRLTLRRA